MASTDRVTARLSTATLVALTNPDGHSATTVDAARLAASAADAEQTFARITGVRYNDADTSHYALIAQGIVVYLRRYLATGTRGGAAETGWNEWMQALREYGLTSGRRWVEPFTTSNLVPTRETASAQVRPVSDPTNFIDIVPRPPSGISPQESAT